MAGKTITIEEAEGHLAELVESIGENGEVILAKGSVPVAKLVSIAQRKPTGRRVFGEYRDRIHRSADFDKPLPDDFWLTGNP